MKKKVIVFGSLNMDLSISCESMPSLGETLKGGHFLQNPGGKGGNQAVAAAKLRAATYILGKVGNDIFGDELKKALISYGVNCDYLLEGPSSSGVAVIIRTSGDNRIIIDPGANSTLTTYEITPLLKDLADPNDIFVTQLECPKETTFNLLKLAKELGMKTIFNPAPADKLPISLYNYVDYLVVNQTECEMITGILPTDEKECTKALGILASYNLIPIITMGIMGSMAIENGEVIKIKSMTVKAVDTTSAGDTYIGALASCLSTDKSLKEAMDFAAKAAAITVTTVGAQKSIPTLECVQSFNFEEI